MSMSDALNTPCAANARAASSISLSRVRDASNGIAWILRFEHAADATRDERSDYAKLGPSGMSRSMSGSSPPTTAQLRSACPRQLALVDRTTEHDAPTERVGA